MSIPIIKPSIVYHYCSLETFLLIIQNSSIRMTNISKSNDSQEITYILPRMKNICENIFEKYNNQLIPEYQLCSNCIEDAFKSSFLENALTFYVACFSEKKDTLSQWRAYADNARGVAIGVSTELFDPLAGTHLSNYSFEQVRYTTDDFEKLIILHLQNELDTNWSSRHPCQNSILLQNALSKTIPNILFNAVFYKNPAFIEESEWRLVFNPFARIRRITRMYDYLDRMQEFMNNQKIRGDFVQSQLSFKASENKITSYIDLKFNDIKKNFIAEVIIGSKADIDDYDLRLLLCSNGYKIDNTTQKKGYIKIFKSSAPYR